MQNSEVQKGLRGRQEVQYNVNSSQITEIIHSENQWGVSLATSIFQSLAPCS